MIESDLPDDAQADEEFEATCGAIDRAIAEFDSGGGMSFEEFKRRLDEKYGV